MKHYIYKTTSANGKFYIGRHSTNNNSTYYGSGKWVRQIKDKSTLTVEIIEYADSFDELLLLEEKYISLYITHPLNMNFNNNSVGWASGELNWAALPESKNFKRQLREGKTYEELFGDRAADIKEKISAKLTGSKRTSAWNTGKTKDDCSSLKQMSESKKGLTPWNKGKKTGLQTFTGKKHKSQSTEKMKETQRLNRINNRVTCQYCNKNLDKANYSKYHGEKCKLK